MDNMKTFFLFARWIQKFLHEPRHHLEKKDRKKRNTTKKKLAFKLTKYLPQDFV